MRDENIEPRPALPYTAGVNRVGLGYDVHQLKTGRPLILGGVEIPYAPGSTAIPMPTCSCTPFAMPYSARLAKGISAPFSCPATRNGRMPQQNFLEEAARQITARNGRLINVDAALIAEAPKIAPQPL